jgi:glycosyltransferase involved in cell wall biosynthesis
MKIAIIHQKYAQGGGMESYLLDLLKGFSEQGDSVSLFVYRLYSQMPKKEGLNVHRMPLAWLPRRWRRYAFWAQLDRTFDRSAFDLSISLTRSSCQDISVCGGTHLGMIHQTPRRSARNRWIHDRIETRFEQRMLQKVPHIMAHSRLIAEELKRFYTFNTDKISILYPPINTEKYKPQSHALIQATQTHYQIDSQKINFLFPSIGHARKGLPELLQTFSRLSNHYQLYLAGTAFSQKLPNNVHHLGYIKNLAPLYAAVNYTILPSHYEPFGLIVPESLACLTPVIVTDCLGAAELLTEKEGVIMPNNDVDTLVHTIKNLPQEKREIAPDFAHKHRLTILQHIDDIKAMKLGAH